MKITKVGISIALTLTALSCQATAEPTTAVIKANELSRGFIVVRPLKPKVERGFIVIRPTNPKIEQLLITQSKKPK